MKTNRILAILVCISVLFGCNKSETGRNGCGGDYNGHYISGFCIATGFRLFPVNRDPETIILIFAQTEDDIYRTELYEELCEYYGDTSYNGNRPRLPHVTMCYADEFTSFDVYSSADFGDIKAGESLADIVMFTGATAKPYIDGNYSLENVDTQVYTKMKEELGEHYEYIDSYRHEGFYPICKRASELTPEEMILLNANFMTIRFTEIPDIKEHTLTIVFRTKDKEVREEIDVVFK